MSCKWLAAHAHNVIRAKKILKQINMFKTFFTAIRSNLKNLDVRPAKNVVDTSSHHSTSDDSFMKELKKQLPIINVEAQKRSPNKKSRPSAHRDYSKNNYRVIRVETRNMNNELIGVDYDAYRVYSTGGRKHVCDEAEIKWAVSQTFKKRKH